MPFVLPHLQQGLSSKDTSSRQGACLGLTEILAAASKKQVEEFLSQLVSTLKKALADASIEVRLQAVKAFQMLFKSVGMRAIQEV
jgi:hypothetical protein